MQYLRSSGGDAGTNKSLNSTVRSSLLSLAHDVADAFARTIGPHKRELDRHRSNPISFIFPLTCKSLCQHVYSLSDAVFQTDGGSFVSSFNSRPAVRTHIFKKNRRNHRDGIFFADPRCGAVKQLIFAIRVASCSADAVITFDIREGIRPTIGANQLESH